MPEASRAVTVRLLVPPAVCVAEPVKLKCVASMTLTAHFPFAAVLPVTPEITTVAGGLLVVGIRCGAPVVMTIGEALVAAVMAGTQAPVFAV